MVVIAEDASHVSSRFGSRKRTRVPGYDYRMPGPYFITICVQGRRPLLGRAVGEAIQNNPAGAMVADIWRTADAELPGVVLDVFVVMPNHVHAILTLGTSAIENNPALGDLVKWFKTVITIGYVKGVSSHGGPRFTDRLWQRGSYDHIIRNDGEFDRIRAYIEENPWNWNRDNLYAADDPAFGG